MLHNTRKPSAPFPTLLPSDEPWHWPMPPFVWRHQQLPANDAVQPCTVESRAGAVASGEMLGVDPAAGTLRFRTRPDATPVALPFSHFRRLTLTTPVLPASRHSGAPLERVPAAAQERDFLLHPSDGRAPLEGRTLGHVETAEALYLYPPVDEERSVLRVLVPRSAYSRCEFGRSAEEIAAERWIATPEALLEAIERQKQQPVMLIGQALLDLGFLTPRQLERALARPPGGEPLGEALVASGQLSRTDLQTALAHKMGYPLVDLARFPVDEDLVRRLPLKLAVNARALPLMAQGDRLIVAVDRPARILKLRAMQAFVGLTMLPVLASKSQILLTLARLSQQDVWSQNVAALPGYFATTT